MRRLIAPLPAAIGIWLVLAVPAWGHAFYVDPGAAPGASCQAGDPCKTIAEAMAIDDPDPGSPDIVVVEPGTYVENVALDATAQVPFADRSLLGAGVGAHVIQPSNVALPTIEIGGIANVVGFTVEGPEPVVFNGPGRVSLSTFASTTVPDGGAHLTIEAGAGGPVVDRNSFLDDGAGAQVAVRSHSTGSPLVGQNGFSGFWRAIEIDAGTPILDGDLAADGGTAVSATGASVDARNLTAFGNSVADLVLQDSDLTLSSSIVERPIVADPASACLAITNSAGPTLGGGPCQGFQQPNDAPGFVDAASGNYHLAATSPLIDSGDPALGSGLDIDGDPRPLDGNCDGVAVHDIGADEFEPDCPPPPTIEPPVGAPPPGAPQPPDIDPPQTSIRRLRVAGRTVSVRFRADVPGSSFLCRLDRRPFRACESPVRYRRVERGRHLFRVTAVDAAGNKDPRPARKRFRVRRRR